MLDITHAQASANILAHVSEGRLTQVSWHGRGADGREIACLLGSIHPSVTSSSECNGQLMPMWLAELTPVLFDGISEADIYPFARRYGELVARWHVLSETQWSAARDRFLIHIIDVALETARPVSAGKPYWPAVEAACAQCKTAIESGDESKRTTARAAASAAARAAARAAAWAAEAAAWAAAWAAARATAWDAARDAAWAAARAAAEAAAYAAWAAAWAAEAAAYSNLAIFLLDQIEVEIKGSAAQ